MRHRQKKKKRRGLLYLCSDGIVDKSNHPQLNNQNSIALQLQMRLRKNKKKTRKRGKAEYTIPNDRDVHSVPVCAHT